MGFLEAAAMLGDGAGKGALFVAEKLRFQKVPGDRAAVHGAVILGRPLALGMDGARHHFLAAAGRAGDDHRSRAGRDLAAQTPQLPDGPAFPDEPADSPWPPGGP